MRNFRTKRVHLSVHDVAMRTHTTVLFFTQARPIPMPSPITQTDSRMERTSPRPLANVNIFHDQRWIHDHRHVRCSILPVGPTNYLLFYEGVFQRSFSAPRAWAIPGPPYRYITGYSDAAAPKDGKDMRDMVLLFIVGESDGVKPEVKHETGTKRRSFARCLSRRYPFIPYYAYYKPGINKADKLTCHKGK